MKRLTSVGMALTICVLALASCGDEADPYQYPSQISVTGNGVATAEPDVAVVVFGVELSDEDPAAAVDDAATKMEAALEAVYGMGLSEDDIETSGYSMWVENVLDPYTYQETGEVRYHVSHMVEVEMDDTEMVGDLLAAVVGAGANTISSVRFQASDLSEVRDRARTLAIEDATEKAEDITGGFGVELEEIVSISEWNTGYPLSRSIGGALASSEVGYTSGVPPMSPASFRVTVSVQVSWKIG